MRYVLPLLLLAACATDTTTTATNASNVVSCQSDPRVSTWKTGLEATSDDGALKVQLLAVSPAPPAHDNENSWQVKLLDKAGQPLPDDTTVTLTPFMPDHGHGTSVVPKITAKGGGVWQVDQINLFMAGVWRFTFGVQTSAGLNATAKFFFCVEG